MEMPELLKLTAFLVCNLHTRKLVIRSLLAISILQAIAAITVPSAAAQEHQASQALQASQEPQILQDTPALSLMKGFRVSLDAGPAWRSGFRGDADGIMKANLPYMGWGYSYGMKLSYAWEYDDQEAMDMGILFRQFRADHGADVMLSDSETGVSRTGRVESHAVITFIGPDLIFYPPLFSSRHRPSVQLGLGWMDYKDRGKVIDPLTMTSSALGCTCGLGYEYIPVSRLSLGVKWSFVTTPLMIGVEDNGVRRYDGGVYGDPLESPMFWMLSFTLSYLCF